MRHFLPFMEASGRVAGMTTTDDHTRKNRSANDVPKPVREQDQERGRTGAFKTAEAEQWHTVANRRKSGNERTMKLRLRAEKAITPLEMGKSAGFPNGQGPPELCHGINLPTQNSADIIGKRTGGANNTTSYAAIAASSPRRVEDTPPPRDDREKSMLEAQEQMRGAQHEQEARRTAGNRSRKILRHFLTSPPAAAEENEHPPKNIKAAGITAILSKLLVSKTILLVRGQH